MNSSSSAKATISSKYRSVSWRDSPRIEAFRYTFSRPVSSGWTPAPSSRSAAIRPWVTTRPSVGRRMPPMTFRSVVFPDPLAPTSPQVFPSGTSNPTSRRAQKSSPREPRRRSRRSFTLVGRSWNRRNRFEIPSTEMAAWGNLQLLREVAGPPVEQPPREVQQHQRGGANHQEPHSVPRQPERRQRLEGVAGHTAVDPPLEGQDDVGQRVQEVEGKGALEIVAHQRGRVHDRRAPEPRQEGQVHQVPGVPVPDVQRGGGHAQGRGEHEQHRQRQRQQPDP